MIIVIKLFLNSKLDFIRTVKFVKQLFRIQLPKGGKVLLWNKVKSRMEACYSELSLSIATLIKKWWSCLKYPHIIWWLEYSLKTGKVIWLFLIRIYKCILIIFSVASALSTPFYLRPFQVIGRHKGALKIFQPSVLTLEKALKF